jgi:uncharacterized membrane protein
MAIRLNLGKHIAPARFLLFLALLVAGFPILSPMLGSRHGMMLSFDIAAGVFLLSLWPLLQASDAADMRRHAEHNDTNRVLLLAIGVAVSLVILVAVFSELVEKGHPKPFAISLIIATLVLSWLFSNMVYALHYAHVFYVQSDTDGDGTREDSGGIDFPKTEEPNYWDFIYFSFTLGMTFQTSDTDITTSRMRRIVTAHCLAAFVFNLGVLAFTINTLGGGN